MSRKHDETTDPAGRSKDPINAGPGVRGAALFLNPWLHGVLLVVLGLIIYSNTLDVPFQFDDPTNISDNPVVRNIESFRSWRTAIQARSLTYFTLAINYSLQGTGVSGYHIVNIAIHCINALLVYGFVMLLFRTPALRHVLGSGGALIIALFSALLFVSHPVQTQAVTYIIQRLASLAAMFSLVAITAYVKSRLMREENRLASSWAWYAVSIISIIAAMKSKETAFTLPIAIVLVEFVFFPGSNRKRSLLLLPVLFTLLIIPQAQLGADKPLGEMLEDVGKASRLETDLPRMQYLYTEFRVIVTYLRLLTVPANQNLDYDYPVFRSFTDPEVVLSFALLAALVGCAIYLLYRDRRAPSPARLVAFGILWFFLSLSVESSVIPIADVIFEHRLYLPSVGFFISVTTALFLSAERMKSRIPRLRQLFAAGLAIVVVTFSVLAYARNRVWQSEASLWEDVIAKSPSKARGYNGLGLAFLNRKEYEPAVQAFSRAIALNPFYATAYNNLGSSLYLTGNYGPAVEAQARAISLQPENAIFRDNRGLSYTAMGDDAHAVADFTSAITIDPSYAKAYHNLGVLYHRRGLYRQAVEQYTEAILRNPVDSIYYGNRGLAYAELREHEHAVTDFTRALALDARNVQAYSGRSEVYLREKRYEDAIHDLTRAIALDPFNTSLLLLRGTAYEQTGFATGAAADFESACEKGSTDGCVRMKRLK